MPVPDQPGGATVPTFAPYGFGSPAARGLPLSGVTILLVEDSRLASDMLRVMCQRSGARLRRAETIEQARSHLRTYCPDVVIVDLGLPDGCGGLLIRDLVCGGREMVVLGCSGDPEGRRLAREAGAQGFLAKPVEGVAAFQTAILEHLPGRRRHAGRVVPVAEGVAVDPLALRDDLAHAAGLLASAPDATERGYLARFVAGIARSAGDSDLADAAGAAALRAEALPRLHHMVQRRLGAGARL